MSFLLGMTYGLMKLAGFPFPLGNPTIVILMLLLGGIQLISVGILGSYVARIYEEVKRRPKFIVDRAIGFNSSSPSYLEASVARVAPPTSLQQLLP